jgi:hypothetical protein
MPRAAVHGMQPSVVNRPNRPAGMPANPAGAHHGHHPAEQHRARAVPVEPGGGAVDVVAAHSEPASPAPDRGLPGVPAHGPGDVAPGHVAEYPGEHDADERRMRPWVGAGGKRAAEQHDDLGRNRDTGRLGQHQQEHRDVPVLGDQVLHKTVPSNVIFYTIVVGNRRIIASVRRATARIAPGLWWATSSAVRTTPLATRPAMPAT